MSVRVEIAVMVASWDGRGAPGTRWNGNVTEKQRLAKVGKRKI